MKKWAPYQFFFPLGILSALLAVGVWLIQDLHWLTTPTILIHSRLIVGGFLWSFITGFLMTAIPRMTDTRSAHFSELVLALGLVIGAIAASWRLDGSWFYLSEMGLILFLIVYGGRRLLYSKKTVPVFFSHVGMAMALAFFGAFSDYRGDSFMGIHLYYVGAVLLLILGIGTRFFSFLSGLPSDFESQNNIAWRWAFHTAGLVTCALLFCAGRGFRLAYLGLAMVLCFYLFGVWRVQRKSDRPSALRYGVRIVASTIPLSFFFCFLWPSMFITWLHLLFIGCFALMTFSVATRVTLAHGSYPLELEMKSKALWCLFICLLVAVVSRLFYGYSEGMIQKSFLHLAATAWFFAVLSWCFSFFMRIFRPGPAAKPAC